MKVAIRVDASVAIGLGHGMRCLTLAEALREKWGAQVTFLSREHVGHIHRLMEQQGFQVVSLPLHTVEESEGEPYAAWLGASWQEDARICSAHLAGMQPDWLVVDHYALDARWEHLLSPHTWRLLVLDDLAQRPHRCDLLLDQTLGRLPADYQALVPSQAQLLMGVHYALLRPEFAQWRDVSLQRRKNAALQHLLISMGGVDQHNETESILRVLQHSALPKGCRITVVLGASAPHLAAVQKAADQMPWATTVAVNVANMAELMAGSDLAIGAAGSSSWERCCLGLPTLMVSLAENQRLIGQHLSDVGASLYLGAVEDLQQAQWVAVLNRLIHSSDQRKELSQRSSMLVDGLGAKRVAEVFE